MWSCHKWQGKCKIFVINRVNDSVDGHPCSRLGGVPLPPHGISILHNATSVLISLSYTSCPLRENPGTHQPHTLLLTWQWLLAGARNISPFLQTQTSRTFASGGPVAAVPVFRVLNEICPASSTT